MDEPKTYHVIIFMNGAEYVASCLEHDVCAFASDVKSAISGFLLTFELECRIGQLEDLEPAPMEIHRMWSDNHEILGVFKHDGHSIIMAMA